MAETELQSALDRACPRTALCILSAMRVTLIAAQSLDGFITRHEESGTAFTSVADKRYFARVLDCFDCSIMGSVTYETSRDAIHRSLAGTNRRRTVLTRRPEAFEADASADRLEFSSESPAALLQRLHARGLRECALLGGAKIHHLFLTQGCVDRVWLTFEPRLFGAGTPLVRGTLDVHLTLQAVERLPDSDSLLAQYDVVR